MAQMVQHCSCKTCGNLAKKKKTLTPLDFFKSVISKFFCLVGCRLIAVDVFRLCAGAQPTLGKYPMTRALIKCLQSCTRLVHNSSGLIFRQGRFLCIKPPHLSRRISSPDQQGLFVHVYHCMHPFSIN